MTELNSPKPPCQVNNPKPILCIIPARSGSKRVKNKNIRPLNGIPLIHYSIQTAIESRFNPIIISTNSKTIANIALQYNPSIQILMRPDSISQDYSTDQNVINHTIAALNVPRKIIIAYLRPTTPLRDNKIIKRAEDRFMTQQDFSALRCVEELTESAYKSFTIDNHQLIPTLGPLEDANLPNQMYPVTYRNNGYIDLYRTPYDDSRVMGFITPRTIEIDTEGEFQYAEWILSHQKAQ